MAKPSYTKDDIRRIVKEEKDDQTKDKTQLMDDLRKI